MMKSTRIFLLLAFLSLTATAQKASPPRPAVIAYFAGDAAQLDTYDARQLTHIIYSFGLLDGNKLKLRNPADSAVLQKMVLLKQKNPQLKVLVSLGGWGGCETCSDVFSTSAGRKEFAASVKKMNGYFGADGIDLDWEYPVVEGFPGHKFSPEDKDNFTGLVQELRRSLGKKAIISFAAGGFQKFLDEAIDWKKVMKKVDYVNLMTYDLVNGGSAKTGHHTALYSTPQQPESTDNAVQSLLKKGVPAEKVIIGAAFYGRIWEQVPNVNNGLYQMGKFKTAEAFKDFPRLLSAQQGYTYHWDEQAQAPYLYNETQGLFVTYDDPRSMKLKVNYVKTHKLGGIMFWQLAQDSPSNGLLNAIYGTVETAAGPAN
ncbi:glycoside hydrolase family 18 protein [Rufibacter hautae]|nr:glycoside hydrolase family 18 protein [Rufibacter hautae]